MKTKYLSKISLLLLGVVLVSFSDPYTIKRISDANFRYEFYTTQKTVKPKTDKIYYWFKGGTIHNAQSGIAGDLLDDKFVKMYHSNQLAEQGVFKKGLKKGLWKTWYPNGVIETTQYWSSGTRYGEYKHFDENGKLLEKGRYGNDKKQGKWINYVSKDTLIYRNGIAKIKTVKLAKEEKEKQNELRKTDEAKMKDAKSNKTLNNDTSATKKEGFFSRLFKKKQPKQNGNG